MSPGYHRGVWDTAINTWVVGPWLETAHLDHQEDVVEACPICGATQGEDCVLPSGAQTSSFVHAARYSGFDPRDLVIAAVRRYQEAIAIGGGKAMLERRQEMWDALLEVEAREAQDAVARRSQSKKVPAKKKAPPKKAKAAKTKSKTKRAKRKS